MDGGGDGSASSGGERQAPLIRNRFLYQERFPWFTVLSMLTSITVLTFTFDAFFSHRVGIDGIGFLIAATFVVVVGLFLNVVWGLVAYARREYCGGRIAAAGIVIPVAIILVLYFVNFLGPRRQ